MSISSTVVLSNHPPDSSNALIRHTPAVPLNPKKFKKIPFTCCSTSKWNAKLTCCNRVSRFSSLLTNDHLACTSPNSSLSYKITIKFTLNYNQIYPKLPPNSPNLHKRKREKTKNTLKWGTVFMRKSGLGWKSASKMATNS
ncbi:hypothetical protein HanRHA438_Chr08g0353931 [Helianthus annuus]|nr:hypothetical protein HanIR_Chr08g0369741 [Helianthus annuus]KAJ0898179.1 hypothetical protein HanRHA438_Chr08g0353931 [Helianthus annuus]